MVINISKDEKFYTLIYSESILAMPDTDQLIFDVINEKENFRFQLSFHFSNEGEPLSTTVWQTPEKNLLIYRLHKWESSTWIEISKPVLLKGDDLRGDYYLKFRSECANTMSHRQFSVTIWKMIKPESYE